MKFVLPVPPSPNRSGASWYGRRANKNSYRIECWAAAVQSLAPFTYPPRSVVIDAAFYLRNLRDEDNLKASLKPVLDALKREQKGATPWKGYDVRGYFLDDSPACCRVNEPTQAIDRKNPRLVLTITPIEGT